MYIYMYLRGCVRTRAARAARRRRACAIERGSRCARVDVATDTP
jgi:hypothetical protein